MSDNNYTPNGDQFYDKASCRMMLLVTEGHFKDWICYKHPDGQWVTLRKATDDDKDRIAVAKLGGDISSLKKG